MDKQTLTREITELHAELCSALADTKRLLILYELVDGPRTVSDLAITIGVSQPTASRHLKTLRDSGLVRPVRQGASVEYSLVDMRIIEALDLLREVLRGRLMYRASLVDEGI